MFYLTDVGCLVVYDNNPLDAAPLRGDRVFAALRDLLSRAGIPVRADASYPVGGPDDGYTAVLLLEAGEDRQADVIRMFQYAMGEVPLP